MPDLDSDAPCYTESAPDCDLEFFDDPAVFLAAVDGYLGLDPVLNTVLATWTERVRADELEGIVFDHSLPRWWLVVRSAGEVVGVAMRSAPFEPHPLYLLPMPDQAARELARILFGRGEVVVGINGSLPAARICAEEMGRLIGAKVEIRQGVRLFELGHLISPPLPPGRLRVAEPNDTELTLAWFEAFMGDADEQAGRPRGPRNHVAEDLTTIRRRIDQGRVWFWENEAGERAHLTQASAPAYGASRIGPVYTAPDHRGHGYATATVSAVSRHVVDSGVRVCLFTDQANPTSNKIYEAIGFRPLVDLANFVIRRDG